MFFKKKSSNDCKIIRRYQFLVLFSISIVIGTALLVYEHRIWIPWSMLRAESCLDLTKFWKKFNFIILDSRETLISGKLQLSISMRNMIYKSYLVSSTYIKIIKLESHYCIGREFWSVYPTGCHHIWLDGDSCQKTSQPRGRIIFHSSACFPSRHT